MKPLIAPILCVSLLAAFAMESESKAAIFTWTGASSSVISTAGNWTPSTAPSSTAGTNSLIFGDSARKTLTGGGTYDDLQVNSAGYVFQVTSNLIINSFSGSALQDTTFDMNTNGAVFTMNVTGSTSFNGKFTNSATGAVGTIRKAGSGLWDISKADFSGYMVNPTAGNNYAQVIYVGNGTLRISNTGVYNIYMAYTGAVNSGPTAIEVSGSGAGTTTDWKTSISAYPYTYPTTTRLYFGGMSSTTAAAVGAVNGNLNWSLFQGGAGTDVTWNNSSSGIVNPSLQLGTADSTGKITLKTTDSAGGIVKMKLFYDKSTLIAVHGTNSTQKVDAEIVTPMTMNTVTTLTGTEQNRIFEKSGAGTLALSGTSADFLGRVLVSQGTLLINGPLYSRSQNTDYGVRVASGAILGGTGSLMYLSGTTSSSTVNTTNAKIEIMGGGVLQAGLGNSNPAALPSFDKLTLKGNIVMDDNSILQFGLGATATESDQFNFLGGTWTFDSDQAVMFLKKGFNETSTGTYTLITGLSGTYDVTNWKIANDVSDNIMGSFGYSDGAITFTALAVPEPSAFALVIGGLGGLVFLSRIRRQQQQN